MHDGSVEGGPDDKSSFFFALGHKGEVCLAVSLPVFIIKKHQANDFIIAQTRSRTEQVERAIANDGKSDRNVMSPHFM